MNTNTNQSRIADCGLRNQNASAADSLRTPHSALRAWRAFTLVELLVVIAVIGVLAGLGLSVAGGVRKQQYIRTATAELNQIETALDNYKAKYGFYPPSNPNLSGYYNTLYYELSGVTNTTPNSPSQTYQTLDGASTITAANYKSAFTSTTPAASLGGIINCTSGGAEDGITAKNFLLGLKANRIGNCTTLSGVPITCLITSMRGPDANYQPVGVPEVNPFRYIYPGTNNPSSYDLWVQLVINGKTNLVCNWSKQVTVNSPLP
jgi:prepilin-type N-terminal cleavage/methylation domain-containing protein